jgi:hypothetical protein
MVRSKCAYRPRKADIWDLNRVRAWNRAGSGIANGEWRDLTYHRSPLAWSKARETVKNVRRHPQQCLC